MISKYVMMMVGAGMMGLATITTANAEAIPSQKQEKRNHAKMVQRTRANQVNEETREARRELMTLVRSYNQAKNQDQDQDKIAKILGEIKAQIAKIQDLRIKEAEKRLEKMKANQAENSAKILKAIEDGDFYKKAIRNRRENRRNKSNPNRPNKAVDTNDEK